MSKTLRRPMFRGGPVNSYNTGITSGLDEGYATGGRVGYKDGPDMYGVQPIDVSKQQQEYYDFIKEYGGGEYLQPGAVEDIYGKKIIDLQEKTKPANFFEFTKSVLNPFQKTYGGISRFGEQRNLEYATSPSGKAAYESEIEKKRKQQAQMIVANPKLAPDKVDLAKSILGIKDNKENVINNGINIPRELTEEEEITKQAKLYQKLLGGDEAKSQSIYDALLAASPAFFKGKNLREAAPEVLTAINKSGAFDKPRDIKQAASQLAIQRAMLKDKAVAEERSRLAIYGAKNQETLAETLKNIPGSFIAGPLPEGFKENTNLLRPGGIYSVGNEKFYAVPGDVVDSSGKKKPGVVSLQKL
jgi:hypothetical protein